MRKAIASLFWISFVIFSLCSCLNGHDKHISDITADPAIVPVDSSLQQILNRDTLIALTDYNSTNYLFYLPWRAYGLPV